MQDKDMFVWFITTVFLVFLLLLTVQYKDLVIQTKALELGYYQVQAEGGNGFVWQRPEECR